MLNILNRKNNENNRLLLTNANVLLPKQRNEYNEENDDREQTTYII